MAETSISGSMPTELLKVVERAKNPAYRFLSLAHLISVAALKRAFEQVDKKAAVGVDGITKEGYEQNLEANLKGLHERMKAGRYHHQPIRRVHIPKAPGKTRPIGISCVEDKIVQRALHEIVQAVYEPMFYEGSYGFRPGRGAHDALRAVDQGAMRGEMNWVFEADIQNFFDSLDRTKLREMLEQRIDDLSLLRLVGKCLRVGVLDGEEYAEPEIGTAQGSCLSPLLGNIYLHHVLDAWFIHEVLPKLRGKAHLIRYADDFVIGFERKDDAEHVSKIIGERMREYGLKLHPDKTRLIPFQKPPKEQTKGKGPGTFDFLGFTIYWCRSRKGGWRLAMKTRMARLHRAIAAVADICRRQRHMSVKEQHAALCRRLNGHYNYFGVNGNLRALRILCHKTEVAWHKWLNRRSQRSRLTWERFSRILESFPIPEPRIRVRIWAGNSP